MFVVVKPATFDGYYASQDSLIGTPGYGRYFLQVAGCRLKFNYNWKTAGT